MDKNAFNDYLQNRYQDQMNYYSKKAALNQKKYKQYQWVLIILSALTPVIAAFNNGDNIYLKITVVSVAAIVAILTTGLKTFNYYELWVTYRSTQELLKPEIYYYTLNVGPYGEPGADKESIFVFRVESILDKEHKSWPPMQKLNEGPKAADTTTPVTTETSTTTVTTETTTTEPVATENTDADEAVVNPDSYKTYENSTTS